MLYYLVDISIAGLIVSLVVLSLLWAIAMFDSIGKKREQVGDYYGWTWEFAIGTRIFIFPLYFKKTGKKKLFLLTKFFGIIFIISFFLGLLGVISI